MNSTAILFAFHRWNKSSMRNFSSFVKHNPDCDVLPISFSTVNARGLFPIASRDQWAGCDTLLYAWFLQNNPSYERYLFMEHDVYCNMPVREFYSRVWRCDFACAEFKSPDPESDEESFGDRGLRQAIGADKYIGLYPYLRACVPVCGTLFQRAALRSISEHAMDERLQYAFSEVRLGTAVNLSGIRPEIIRKDVKDYIAWNHTFKRGRGVFHKRTTRPNTIFWHLKETVRLTFTRKNKA